jgi:multiple sugar transport system ATP-binding protein
MSLEIKNLTKTYMGGSTALSEFNLNINDTAVIVGGEMAGKTTLLKCIAGLESYEGEILIGGVNIKKIKPKKRNIFMFFPDYAIFPNRTVFYNLGYSLMVRGLTKIQMEEKLVNIAEKFGIRGLLFKKAKALTEAQKRTVAIARMFVRQADIYLLDDPLKGLYGTERKELFEKLRIYLYELNGIKVYTTTEVDEALALSRQIVILNLGYTKQIGSMETFYNAPQSVLVAQMIGDMNIVRGMLCMRDIGLCAEFAGHRFLLRDSFENRLISKSYIGKEVLFGFRPEKIMVCSDGIEAQVLGYEAKKGYYLANLMLGNAIIKMETQNIIPNKIKIHLELSNVSIFDIISEASVLKE